MAFSVTVRCDEVSCRDKQEVNQVGALPLNWIGTTYPERKINISNPDPRQPQVETEQKVFCSWKCLYKFAEGRIGKKDDGQKKSRKRV